MIKVKCFTNVFKVLCIIAACCMIGFWIHKYSKDEDVSLIEYKSIQDAEDVLLPVSTICFWNPFLNSVFENQSMAITNETYRQYLLGDNGSNQNYRFINYDQVTMNLSNYVSSVKIGFRAERNKTDVGCTNLNNCSYASLENNYNGFVADINLMKCFGFKVSKAYSKDVNYLLITFKESFGSVLNRFSDTFMSVHYPGQFVRNKGIDESIWNDPGNDQLITHLNIKFIEILQRRDKPGKECLTKSTFYDNSILFKHMAKVGCRAPYHSAYEEVPICASSRKVKEYHYNGFEQSKTNILDPCHEITYMSLKYTTGGLPIKGLRSFPLIIYFPDKVKYVTQHQAIDIHTLIGNIGGYIGLFLGYAMIQMPEFAIYFSKRIKAWTLMMLREQSESSCNRHNIAKCNKKDKKSIVMSKKNINHERNQTLEILTMKMNEFQSHLHRLSHEFENIKEDN